MSKIYNNPSNYRITFGPNNATIVIRANCEKQAVEAFMTGLVPREVVLRAIIQSFMCINSVTPCDDTPSYDHVEALRIKRMKAREERDEYLNGR